MSEFIMFIFCLYSNKRVFVREFPQHRKANEDGPNSNLASI